jgi:hypothetical protein
MPSGGRTGIHMSSRLRFVIALSGLLALAACGGAGQDGTSPSAVGGDAVEGFTPIDTPVAEVATVKKISPRFRMAGLKPRVHRRMTLPR